MENHKQRISRKYFDLMLKTEPKLLLTHLGLIRRISVIIFFLSSSSILHKSNAMNHIFDWNGFYITIKKWISGKSTAQTLIEMHLEN